MILLQALRILALSVVTIGLVYATAASQTAVPSGLKAEVYEAVEIQLAGPHLTPRDQPTKRIQVLARFRHEAGSAIAIWGFWDGDGRGGSAGGVFKLRFTPTLPGRWTLERNHAPGTPLDRQKEGLTIEAVETGRRGFWVPAAGSAGGRWFQRSSGGFPYIVGNTHYDFLFRPRGQPTSPGIIRQEVRANAEFFNKLRFCLMQPRPENADPELKPFFDAEGHPTDEETGEPNPAFFHQRVDPAVLEAAAHDVIADLILGGTAGDQIATHDGFMRYVAARYGAFPNVWLTVGQEWNEQLSPREMVAVGTRMKQWLSYPLPLSTHPTAAWSPALNGDWHTHAIIQGKIGNLKEAAEAIFGSYTRVDRKPVINDENGYDPGEASTPDVVEGIMGSFLGGGYGTTGHRLRNKAGGYFWGHVALGERLAEVHPSAPHLQFLRTAIERHIPFWRLQPLGAATNGPFDAPREFRAMKDGEQVFVIGTNKPAPVTANLGAGRWRVTQIDAMARTVTELGRDVAAPFRFVAPESRAVLTVFVRGDANLSTPVAPDEANVAAGRDEPLRIKTTPEQIDPGEVGRSYGDDLEATGGQPPYRWTLVAGALPPGMRIEGSELAGEPQQSGRFEFTVRVTDATGVALERALVLTVRPRPEPTVLIDDPLEGRTVGELAGGVLTPVGYFPAPTGAETEAHILYRLPRTVERGELEFEVRGLGGPPRPNFAHGGEPALVAMYDGRNLPEPVSYFDDFKNNFYRFVLAQRTRERRLLALLVAARPGAPLEAGKPVWDGEKSRQFSTEQPLKSMELDPERWFRVRVAWDGGTMEIAIDGELVWSVLAPYPYAPGEHRVRLGSAPGRPGAGKYTAHSAGLTFRRFRLREHGAPGS